MKGHQSILFSALAVILLPGLVLNHAFAQRKVTPSGNSSVCFVTYFSNANTKGAPDATVRIVNDGSTGRSLWAVYYVFDDDQELTESCACFVSPDGIDSESVNAQLTANPLTGGLLTHGVIKVVSSASSDPDNVVPMAGLHGWATHVQKTGSGYAVTESVMDNANSEVTPVADLKLRDEETSLRAIGEIATSIGSGKGVCTCTKEDRDF